MTSLIDAAAGIMGNAARQIEVAGANIANVSTPGFKQLRLQSTSAASDGFAGALEQIHARLDQGKLFKTGRTFDLAVSGDGYLAVRTGNTVEYVRNGQFSRTSDGVLVAAQGGVLQQSGGGDLVVSTTSPDIRQDGIVIEDGRATGKLGLFKPGAGEATTSLDGATFELGNVAHEAPDAEVRQGFLEASNVDTGDQMVTMMAALRQSEAGAKLVQTYDDLLGRAFSALGQAGR